MYNVTMYVDLDVCVCVLQKTFMSRKGSAGRVFHYVFL